MSLTIHVLVNRHDDLTPAQKDAKDEQVARLLNDLNSGSIQMQLAQVARVPVPSESAVPLEPVRQEGKHGDAAAAHATKPLHRHDLSDDARQYSPAQARARLVWLVGEAKAKMLEGRLIAVRGSVHLRLDRLGGPTSESMNAWPRLILSLLDRIAHDHSHRRLPSDAKQDDGALAKGGIGCIKLAKAPISDELIEGMMALPDLARVEMPQWYGYGYVLKQAAKAANKPDIDLYWPSGDTDFPAEARLAAAIDDPAVAAELARSLHAGENGSTIDFTSLSPAARDFVRTMRDEVWELFDLVALQRVRAQLGECAKDRSVLDFAVREVHWPNGNLTPEMHAGLRCLPQLSRFVGGGVDHAYLPGTREPMKDLPEPKPESKAAVVPLADDKAAQPVREAASKSGAPPGARESGSESAVMGLYECVAGKFFAIRVNAGYAERMNLYGEGFKWLEEAAMQPLQCVVFPGQMELHVQLAEGLRHLNSLELLVLEGRKLADMPLEFLQALTRATGHAFGIFYSDGEVATYIHRLPEA